MKHLDVRISDAWDLDIEKEDVFPLGPGNHRGQDGAGSHLSSARTGFPAVQSKDWIGAYFHNNS